MNPAHKKKIEEKFNDISEAYHRLDIWIGERDDSLNSKIDNNQAPGVNVDHDDGSYTYTLGALKLRGKVAQLDKQQLLIQMIEDDLTVKEPKNLLRWLWMIWAGIGIYACTWSQEDGQNNFKRFLESLKYENPDIDYN